MIEYLPDPMAKSNLCYYCGWREKDHEYQGMQPDEARRALDTLVGSRSTQPGCTCSLSKCPGFTNANFRREIATGPEESDLFTIPPYQSKK